MLSQSTKVVLLHPGLGAEELGVKRWGVWGAYGLLFELFSFACWKTSGSQLPLLSSAGGVQTSFLFLCLEAALVLHFLLLCCLAGSVTAGPSVTSKTLPSSLPPDCVPHSRCVIAKFPKYLSPLSPTSISTPFTMSVPSSHFLITSEKLKI